MNRGDAQIVENLRRRWPNELVKFTDKQVAQAYREFSQSEDHGNNDEKFPLWFDVIGEIIEP